MTNLDGFFTAMRPFLLGERSAEETLAVLGPSPSGVPRFALYAELVARQRRGIIDHFYRPVKTAAESTKQGLFAELRDEWLRITPPRHWSPNEAARGFSEFLEAHPKAPRCLSALADFAWVRFAAMHAEHHPHDVGLDVAVFVRHYDWDVIAFSAAVEREGLLTGLPVAASQTALIGRHREACTLVVLTPSLGALLALRTATAEPDAATPLPCAVAPTVIVEEALALERAGLVPTGTATRLAYALDRASLVPTGTATQLGRPLL